MSPPAKTVFLDRHGTLIVAVSDVEVGFAAGRRTAQLAPGHGDVPLAPSDTVSMRNVLAEALVILDH